MSRHEDDRRFMELALALGRHGLGTTAPNPSVGAVIVAGEGASAVVVARAWTQPGGRPHAETEALRRAGAAARGATMYVTLEPCSHHGRTPPCADAIIAAGIKRLVSAHADPDPRVAGRGFDLLRSAGIEVVTGVCEEAARWLHAGHILRKTEGRPQVLLKMALDAEGRIARGRDGRPVWVTGPQARAQGQLVRASVDGVLIGRVTAIDDDPELTVRLPGMAQRSPVRIVLDKELALPVTSKLAASAHRVPTWVLTGPAVDAGRRRDLERAGVRVEVLPVRGPHLMIEAVLSFLADQGLTRVMVEGGPHIWRAFNEARVVDEAVVYLAGRAGKSGAAQTMPSELKGEAAALMRDLTITRETTIGTDLAVWLARPKPPEPARPRAGTSQRRAATSSAATR